MAIGLTDPIWTWEECLTFRHYQYLKEGLSPFPIALKNPQPAAGAPPLGPFPLPWAAPRPALPLWNPLFPFPPRAIGKIPFRASAYLGPPPLHPSIRTSLDKLGTHPQRRGS